MGGTDFAFAGHSGLERQPGFAVALIGSLKLGEVRFGEVDDLGAVVADDGLEKLAVAGLDD